MIIHQIKPPSVSTYADVIAILAAIALVWRPWEHHQASVASDSRPVPPLGSAAAPLPGGVGRLRRDGRRHVRCTHRYYVGDVVEATETDDEGRLDRDTEFGKSDYRNTKGRGVSGLSIGHAIRNSTNTAAGHM